MQPINRDAWAEQRAAIRAELRQQGITQKAAAARLGITEKHISQMLTGAVDGRLELWVNLATMVGMTWRLAPICDKTP